MDEALALTILSEWWQATCEPVVSTDSWNQDGDNMPASLGTHGEKPSILFWEGPDVVLQGEMYSLKRWGFKRSVTGT